MLYLFCSENIYITLRKYIDDLLINYSLKCFLSKFVAHGVSFIQIIIYLYINIIIYINIILCMTL
jgi:hypothetical protein